MFDNYSHKIRYAEYRGVCRLGVDREAAALQLALVEQYETIVRFQARVVMRTVARQPDYQ